MCFILEKMSIAIRPGRPNRRFFVAVVVDLIERCNQDIAENGLPLRFGILLAIYYHDLLAAYATTAPTNPYMDEIKNEYVGRLNGTIKCAVPIQFKLQEAVKQVIVRRCQSMFISRVTGRLLRRPGETIPKHFVRFVTMLADQHIKLHYPALGPTYFHTIGCPIFDSAVDYKEYKDNKKLMY